MKKLIFFGEHGITATSANHLANIGKEHIKQIEDKLNSISFVNQDVSLLAGGAKKRVSHGDTDLTAISDDLNHVAKIKSFIAWIREAIKAKEELTNKLRKISLDEFLKETGKTSLAYPEKQSYETLEDLKSEMTIKEMNEYFTLEAIAAQIGNYIHPGKPYASARDQALKKLSNPVSTIGSGSEMIINEYSVTVDPEKIDGIFFDLQNQHREINARLNQIKYNLEQELQKRNLKKDADFKVAFAAYAADNGILNSEFSIWQSEQLQKIQNLKIVIPEALQSVYEFLTNLKK